MKANKIIFFCFLFVFLSDEALAKISGDLTLPIDSSGKSFAVPFTNNTLPLTSNIKVLANDKPIAVKASYALLWPTTATNQPYIRVLNLVFDHAVSSNSITIEWNESHSQLQQSSKDVRLNSKLIYPSISWLRQVLLLTNNSGVDEKWYRKIQELTANYLADEDALRKDKYPRTVASQWLYDKAQAFYQLYLATENKRWKKFADRYVVFYKSHINDDGYFTLSKPNDMKYLMGRSLVYHYLLTQSESSLDVLEKIYTASLAWGNEYSLGTGFWTERHHAAALNVAISYWELTGDPSAQKRVEQLITTLMDMTFSPVDGWPKRDCPQHSFNAHEGWGDKTAACSPWMMALIADNLWRYYWLTGSDNATKLLASFADFVAQYGLYTAKEGKIKGQAVPKYIVSLDNEKQEELDPWSDRHHTCDVAAMVGKGLYFQQEIGNSVNPKTSKVFQELAHLCQQQHLATIEKYKYVKLDRLTSKPPRKFNWQYSTTDDLPWLMSVFHILKNK